MDSDDFLQIPANVSTIADLFDIKHIAWGEYQEDMLYAGYQGMRYPLSGSRTPQPSPAHVHYTEYD